MQAQAWCRRLGGAGGGGAAHAGDAVWWGVLAALGAALVAAAGALPVVSCLWLPAWAAGRGAFGMVGLCMHWW